VASDAISTLRELVSGPGVPPAVRLRASLEMLQANAVLKADEIGPASVEGVDKMHREQLLESLGG
jgi:hypothetical protein